MRIVALGLLFVNLLFGQSHRDLRLQEPRTIRGIVVDQRGIPVENAEIAHARIRPNPVGGRTDAEGRFQLTTDAPLIVIRKSGYSSAFLRTAVSPSNGEPPLVLHLVRRSLMRCHAKGTYRALAGWESQFRFAAMPSIRVSKQGQDVDYGMRIYSVKTAKGLQGIRHGSGPLWSLGLPSDSDVWKSVVLEEDSFEVDGFRIVDSKGEWADGTRWRTIGKFGESASYSRMESEIAKVLDQFMDGLCIASLARSDR
jgi:hypothetical protein